MSFPLNNSIVFGFNSLKEYISHIHVMKYIDSTFVVTKELWACPVACFVGGTETKILLQHSTFSYSNIQLI